jgi:hypothetical protein
LLVFLSIYFGHYIIYLSSIYLFGLPRPGLTLRQISTYLGNQGAGDSTKIRPQGNLFYQSDIRLKNTHKKKQKNKKQQHGK